MQHVQDIHGLMHQYWLMIHYLEEKIMQIIPISWEIELQEKESGDLLVLLIAGEDVLWENADSTFALSDIC